MRRRPRRPSPPPRASFFERFSRERNVADVKIVPSWETYRCLDFSYDYPACAWLQRSPAAQYFVVAELLPHDMTTDEFAEAILEREKGFGLVEQPRRTYAIPPATPSTRRARGAR